MRDSLRRAAVPALSFLIPALVMLWAFAAMGMAPWGDKTILISDMSTQYVEFFCALKNGDLFFSWAKALGTAYIGVFSYYVSSPLSLLTLLVPNENMPVGLMFLTALKLGLAGLSYAVYSTHKFPGAEITTVLCASCYGLMSYNIAFSMDIMWLDGVIWLPLILLALERVLAGKSVGPFIAALTVCFISTWYISYMIGIFCCVYLAARLVGLKPDRATLFRVLRQFFTGAACALGLTAWLWLPTFLNMFYGKFQVSEGLSYGAVYGPLSDIFDQLQMGKLTSIAYTNRPNIYCGTVTALLAAVWFFLPKVPLREKLANAGALVFLVLSMWFTALDKIWHLFQYTHWFPFRYSFVVSFFLIYLANQALPGLREAFKEKLHPALAQVLATVLLVFTALELTLNANLLLIALDGTLNYQNYENYRDFYTATAELVDRAKSDGGSDFFRINATWDRGNNSPLSFGYPGIAHSSSAFNASVNRLLRDLGLAQDWYWSSGHGSTPVTDALLGIRYVISRNTSVDWLQNLFNQDTPPEDTQDEDVTGWDAMPSGYEVIVQGETYTLWKTPDTLPLAFFASDGSEALTRGTPFQRQNGILSALAGEEVTVFAPVEALEEIQPGKAVYTVTGTGKPLYMDLSADGLEDVLVNGELVLSLEMSQGSEECVHYLGTPNPGETWTVTVNSETNWTGQVWALDQEALREALERVNRARVTSVESSGRVRLTVETDRDRTLATTIPAEGGWRVWVDGERVDTGVWLNTFLSVDIPAGAHEVELRYTAPGLVPGLALGLVSAAGLALAYIKRRKGIAP